MLFGTHEISEAGRKWELWLFPCPWKCLISAFLPSQVIHPRAVTEDTGTIFPFHFLQFYFFFFFFLALQKTLQAFKESHLTGAHFDAFKKIHKMPNIVSFSSNVHYVELTVTCSLLVSCHRTAALHCRPIFLHKEKIRWFKCLQNTKRGDFT